MNDNAVSNIKQILSSFDNFVIIFENPSWIRSAKAEDIKTAFKLGYFLEKSITHFKSEGSLSEFLRMLEEWWMATKNRTKVYNEQFFQFACDELLKKFFKTEAIAEVTLDIAIRIYTSIFPKDRLQNVLSDLLLTSSSYQAVTEFANTTITECEKNELKYHLKLTSWAHLLETGQENVVMEELTTCMSLYKIESTLELLIGILSLSDVQGIEKSVQNIILENIVEKMLDRSVLIKSFWITLFKQVDIECVCKASCNFQQFLVSLFSFIVYLGGMMQKKNGTWESDSITSLCPEISYHDLVLFIKSIHNVNSTLKEYVIKALNEAKEYTESSIWDELNQNISL